MALIDTYRNSVQRLTNDINKLKSDSYKEQAKITSARKKISSAESTINRTKSQSTVKSKLNEIDRANKAIIESSKKCDTIQAKIVKKEKELATAEKRLQSEEAREDKRRQQESKNQMNNVMGTLRQQELRQQDMLEEIEQLKRIPDTITVLFMASNPNETPQLGLDKEVRSIMENIRKSEFRESINFESRWSVRAADVLQSINETNPTIVHFSGHGAPNGELVLQNPDGSSKFVPKEAITAAISTASDVIELVVFNACFSDEQAHSVTQYVKAAIGMTDSIGDQAACIFAAQLYSSIGFGHPLQKAFNQAKAALMLEGIPEDSIPKLYARPDVDLGQLILVNPE